MCGAGACFTGPGIAAPVSWTSCSAAIVDVHIADLDDQALDDLETLMAAPEPQLYGWLTGQMDVPENYDTALLNAIRSFHGVDGDTAGLKR